MGVVHASRGTLAPGSPHLLCEVAIVARLGARLRSAAARRSRGPPSPTTTG